MIIRLKETDPMVFGTHRQTRVLGGVKGLPVRGFTFGYVEVECGGSVPVHSHSQEEVYFVISGCASMRIDGREETLNAGDAAYIPSNSEHELFNQGNDRVKFMFIYSPSEMVSHWSEELAHSIS